MSFRDLSGLANKIEDHLNDSNNILNPPFQEIREFARDELKSVEGIAARMIWTNQSSKGEITDEAYKAYFNLKREIFRFVNLKSESTLELKQKIQQFVVWMKKIEEKYDDELYNPLPPGDEDDDVDDVSASTGLESKMVGLYDQYYQLKVELLKARYSKVQSLVGMPGIGKTTLASKVFVDPDIVKHFNVRVWIKVGGRCPLKRIPRRVLARVDPDRLNQVVKERDVYHHLRESLKGKRCLIVFDDVWERCNDVQKLFGVTKLGKWSCVLLTSRLQEMQHAHLKHNVRLLNEEESWDLLRDKVFREESCPIELEKAGKKIAENCEGHPLTIVTIANHLSKVKEATYWNEVAAKKKHKLFKGVYNEISEVILPSYNFLPRVLQVCFLYIGIFPQNYEIPRSKLINMWNVDGFLKRNKHFDALDCLEEVVRNSLVMIHKTTTGFVGKQSIKTCGLHSFLWYFSTTKARMAKFCHVLSSLDDGLDGDIIGQRRLSFHNNILCTIKDVYQLVEDNCASTVRSLFYYGPYHPFQVPICFGLRLLKELDILSIRFYEFPIEVLRLVELRYLAITFDGKLPASISQLSSLQFLGVGRHFVVIKPSRDRYLPVEIWNMQELQHLQAMGSDLPHPGGASFQNLSTLSNVGASSCTEEVFKAIPNLEKLGFRIELGPNDDGAPLRCFDHISCLKKLTSLKCVVVNPIMIIPGNELRSFRSAMERFRSSKLGQSETNDSLYHREKLRYLNNPRVKPPLAPFTALPSNLRKLSLSGLGFPWKDMRKIDELPNLKVLKLKNYAFRGAYWRVKRMGFPALENLVIEDSDIVEWCLGSGCLKKIHRLTLKNCYKYERMIGDLGYNIAEIEFFDCNPSGIMQMQQTVRRPKERHIEWRILSSLADGENKTQ